MSRCVGLVLAIIVALGLAVPASATADLTKLNAAVALAGQLNVVTFNDLTTTANRTIEGKAFVGGNVVGALTVGAGDTSKTELLSNYSTITVGKNVSGTLTLKNGTNGTGKISAAGSVSGGYAANYGALIGGNAATITISDKTIGTSIGIGGNDTGTISTGASSIVAIRGSANSLTMGNGSTLNVGTNVTSLNTGQTTVSRIGGNVGNAGAGTVTLGTNSTTYIGGQLQKNTLTNFTGNVYTNGARYDTSATAAPAAYHFNQNNYFVTPASPVDAINQERSTFLDELVYLSYGLSTLTASQHLTTLSALPTSAFGSATYVVFQVDNGAAFFSQSGSISTLLSNMPSNVTVIINVNGATINQSATFATANYAQDLLWNFYNATSTSLTTFQGTVLAPKSTVSNSGTITGSVIASVFNQNNTVNLGTFQGNMTDALSAITVPDNAVPEPTTWAMMLLGFGAIGWVVRRKGSASVLAII